MELHYAVAASVLSTSHDSPAAAAGDTTGEMGSAHTEVLYLPADGPSPCTRITASCKSKAWVAAQAGNRETHSTNINNRILC